MCAMTELLRSQANLWAFFHAIHPRPYADDYESKSLSWDDDQDRLRDAAEARYWASVARGDYSAEAASAYCEGLRNV